MCCGRLCVNMEQPAAREQTLSCPGGACCSLMSHGATGLVEVFPCRHLCPVCLWGCFNLMKAQEEL